MNQPQQPQPIGPSQPGAIAPWLLILFIIVFLAGGGYLGWYFWNQSKAKTATPTDTSTTTSTIDWKTYKNDTYDFSVKYPNNWEYTTAVGGDLVYTTGADKPFIIFGKKLETGTLDEAHRLYAVKASGLPAVAISIYDENVAKTKQTALELAYELAYKIKMRKMNAAAVTQSPPETIDVIEMTIDGIKAAQVNYSEMKITIIVNNNKWYYIATINIYDIEQQQDMRAIYDQILSTFQFSS